MSDLTNRPSRQAIKQPADKPTHEPVYCERSRRFCIHWEQLTCQTLIELRVGFFITSMLFFSPLGPGTMRPHPSLFPWQQPGSSAVGGKEVRLGGGNKARRCAIRLPTPMHLLPPPPL